jgi:hypothetical protein
MALPPKDVELRSQPAQHLFKHAFAGSSMLAERWYLIVE